MLTRRGSTWWIDVRIDGERFRETTGTSIRREAEKFLILRQAELLANPRKVAAPKRVTLKQLTKLWLEHASEKRSISTTADAPNC